MDEVARAARVVSSRLQAVAGGAIHPGREQVSEPEDAVPGGAAPTRGRAGPAPRAPLTLLPKRRRKAGASLVLSGLLHEAMLVLLLTLASLGLLNSVDTEQTVVNPTPSAWCS